MTFDVAITGLDYETLVAVGKLVAKQYAGKKEHAGFYMTRGTEQWTKEQTEKLAADIFGGVDHQVQHIMLHDECKKDSTFDVSKCGKGGICCTCESNDDCQMPHDIKCGIMSPDTNEVEDVDEPDVDENGDICWCPFHAKANDVQQCMRCSHEYREQDSTAEEKDRYCCQQCEEQDADDENDEVN